MSECYPVQVLAAVLAASKDRFEVARMHLEGLLGPVDFESGPVPFSHTEYYAEEMGRGLNRWLVSFKELAEPSEITRIKASTMRIEQALSVRGNRTVNIDPGYMDFHKVVLASMKYNGPKVYLGSGVWADITLFYGKGKFVAPEWSFPDFKSGVYDRMLLEIRMLYKRKMKAE